MVCVKLCLRSVSSTFRGRLLYAAGAGPVIEGIKPSEEPGGNWTEQLDPPRIRHEVTGRATGRPSRLSGFRSPPEWTLC